jgi:hypothetical protein
VGVLFPAGAEDRSWPFDQKGESRDRRMVGRRVFPVETSLASRAAILILQKDFRDPSGKGFHRGSAS